jgi:competence protein ComGC
MTVNHEFAKVLVFLSFLLLLIMIVVGCDKNAEMLVETGSDQTLKEMFNEEDTVNRNNHMEEKASLEELEVSVGAVQRRNEQDERDDSDVYTIELYEAEETYGADGYDHEDYVDVDRDIGYTSPIPYKGRIIAGFPQEIPIPRKPVDMTMRKDNVYGMTSYSLSFEIEMPIEELIKLYQSYVAKAVYIDVEEEREDRYYDITGTRDVGTFSISISPSSTWDRHYYVNLNYLVIS